MVENIFKNFIKEETVNSYYLNKLNAVVGSPMRNNKYNNDFSQLEFGNYMKALLLQLSLQYEYAENS